MRGGERRVEGCMQRGWLRWDFHPVTPFLFIACVNISSSNTLIMLCKLCNQGFEAQCALHLCAGTFFSTFKCSSKLTGCNRLTWRPKKSNNSIWMGKIWVSSGSVRCLVASSPSAAGNITQSAPAGVCPGASWAAQQVLHTLWVWMQRLLSVMLMRRTWLMHSLAS